jgi:murein endopeptidase
MRLRTFLLAAVIAIAAAAALPIMRNAGGGHTATAVAPATAAQQRSSARAQAPPTPPPRATRAPRRRPAIQWRHSSAVGSPSAGRLIRGVQLPARGPGYVTWDANLHRSPNRAWRRWGTDRLLRKLLTVARAYHRAHPGARPLLVGDLSRPHGGDFGRQYGYVWHASHQNGLDVDIYYPRTDAAPRQVRTAADMNTRLSQDIVNRFARAGAVKLFVGPNTGLTGPPGVLGVLPDHDDHVHVRIGP